MLNHLAEFYVAQGRYEEAEPLFRRTLTIRERALEPQHSDVGATLNALAELYRAQGQTENAERLLRGRRQ